MGKSRCGGVGEDDDNSLPRAAANATEEDAAAAASGMLSCDGQGRHAVAEVVAVTEAATAGALWSPFIVFGLELSPVEGLDFVVVDFVFVKDALCFLPSSFWL